MKIESFRQNKTGQTNEAYIELLVEPKYSDGNFNGLSSNSINRLSLMMPRYWLKLVFHLSNRLWFMLVGNKYIPCSVLSRCCDLTNSLLFKAVAKKSLAPSLPPIPHPNCAH